MIIISKYDFILDDLTWSFSKLKLYHTCPYAFYLQYIKNEEKVENAFAQFGTFCHKLLEEYAKHELEVFELSSKFQDDYYTNVTEWFPFKKMGEGYFNKGLAYFEGFEGFDDYNILGVEKEVKFSIDRYKFIGYIDLLAEHKLNKTIHIIDHKSKGEFKTKEEENTYFKQLYTYSIPVIKEQGKNPDSLIFNMFRNNKWLERKFDINEFEESKEWCLDIINKIYNDDEFVPKSEKFFCSYMCNHRHICEFK